MPKVLTDEELCGEYLGTQKEVKNLEVNLDQMKTEITERIASKGVEKGKHREVLAGKYSMLREARVTLSVENDLAVKLLEANQLPEFIEKMAEIKIKDSIDKIPPKLIKEMDKYFDIAIHKTVDKDTLKMLASKGKISEHELKNVTSEKITYAIKVKEV